MWLQTGKTPQRTQPLNTGVILEIFSFALTRVRLKTSVRTKHSFLEVVGCSVEISFVIDAAADKFSWFHQYFDLKERIFFRNFYRHSTEYLELIYFQATFASKYIMIPNSPYLPLPPQEILWQQLLTIFIQEMDAHNRRFLLSDLVYMYINVLS